MATTTKNQTKTLQQRLNEAVRRVAEKNSYSSLKVLTVALVEAASEIINYNEMLAIKVDELYNNFLSTQTNSGRKTVKKNEADIIDLVPIKRIVGREFDVNAPLDPYFLHELYGNEQLPLALSRFSVKRLMEGVTLVEKNSGEKPRNKATKGEIIEFLVTKVTGHS